MEQEERELANTMIEATAKTRSAIDHLTTELLARDHAAENRMNDLSNSIAELRLIVIGKSGDNGLSTRVKMLERSRGHVSWAALGMVAGLLLAAVGVWLS